MTNKLWMKLLEPRIWYRVYRERMGEPLVYNIVSLFVLLFGSFRKRIEYDLVPRQPYAFCILAAADYAKAWGVKKITLIEFGVAAGAGLLNMCWIAHRVSKETGIEFEIIGFDGGEGMPTPRDYRDHPEKYFTGDYPVIDKNRLLSQLPPNARIIFGNVGDSIAKFRSELKCPIGFVSVDVDYYWSAKECLEIFNLDADNYLSHVWTYLDDVDQPDDNEFCGELLAINEFNRNNSNTYRKIAPANCLEHTRIFKTPVWLRQVYLTHIFDHRRRSIEFQRQRGREIRILTNPHI